MIIIIIRAGSGRGLTFMTGHTLFSPPTGLSLTRPGLSGAICTLGECRSLS